MWILLFALLAPFTPTIDRYVSGLFYTPGVGFYDNAFFHALFHYGVRFGMLTGQCAGVVFLLSFVWPKLKKWRRGALVMGLTLAIGAGLITNLGFKEHWGRPRPKQIVEFGGKHLYRPFWKPDFHTRHDPQKSFPSGHASVGFYFLSVCLVGKRYRSRLIYNVGLFLVLFMGIGLMISRIVQGGHFVSDVLASAILMWYVAKFVDKAVFTWGGSEQRTLCSKSGDTSQAPDQI